MKPSVALEMNREAIRAAVGQRKAANRRVFGSVLRGEDHDGSDIDIRRAAGGDPPRPGGLMSDLEEILGVRVDLLTPAELPRQFRAEVLAEARPI